ncbi:hypothetical protein [Sphingomonas profundi]|uniref:hypothetical protein n=1 Tax=Alterirhizorhabdus profundi TaxID=2681549 RepID=UPI0018D12B8B|nr:hypothetical protein [Sphingomonas profundi]
MTDKLNDLIKKAAKIRMSDDDKEAQRQSFAYGNAHIENDRVTRDMIEAAAKRISRG